MKASPGPSTRAASSRPLAAVTAAIALLLVAGCEPQLEIVLVRAATLEVSPPFVKFQMWRLGDTEPDEQGPFAIRAIPDELFTAIEPDTFFYIDVIGCQTDVVEECVEPERFVARGCSAYLSLAREEPLKSVTIELQPPLDGALVCPPERPVPSS
jgi:hypothetical protein